ncbi:MAG: hypothetical protein AAF628_22995 [Planctomycetota bacterium]
MLIRAVFALGLAATLPAQVMGSINTDAPTVRAAIEFANGAEIELSYTAVRFGSGEWLGALADAERQAAFNARAEQRPIGEVKTTRSLIVAGNVVPASTYDLYFTVEGDDGWKVNLRRQGDPDAVAIFWRLHPKGEGPAAPRLQLGLTAGAEATAAVFLLAFGERWARVPFVVQGE